MNKTVFGMLLGAFLGIFDGLTALISAPELKAEIMGIVIGSTIKGLIVGAIVGWYATRVHSIAKGVIVGMLVSAFFAFLVAVIPRPDGATYYWEIMLPGAVLGVIVGYATQTFGTAAARPNAARR
jgi:hypothetical protein